MSVVEQWVGHFQGGGSDKVWAGAYTSDGHFLSCWGRRGAKLSAGDTPFKNQEEAAKQFTKKLKSKIGEGYKAVEFDHPDYGVPSFGEGVESSDSSAPSVASLVAAVAKDIKYQTGHVTGLSEAQLEEAFTDPNEGVSEKVNGERCLVTCDGAGNLEAYNRKGQAVSTVPQGARDLCKLNVQFVIDGERLTGEQHRNFVAFDILEWDNQDARNWPYSRRISTLETALVDAGLIKSGSPTFDEASGDLHLLVSEADEVKGRAAVAKIQATKGEGVIVRNHKAVYQAGDTKHIRKYKYLADLDAEVIGVNPGLATGSVILGLTRPTDGAIIEVCKVRGGLKDEDINKLGQMVANGERPVLKVEYLPARTVGTKLVEPKTNISQLRTDKLASECTTEQLGEAKAEMVKAAKPYKTKISSGVSL